MKMNKLQILKQSDTQVIYKIDDFSDVG